MTKDKWISVGKGALIAGAGAALAYLLNAVGTLPLGAYAPLATAVLSVAVNAVHKYASAS